jgi:hypothetical protein
MLAGVRVAASLLVTATAACWRGPAGPSPSDPPPSDPAVAAIEDAAAAARKARCRNPPGEKLASFNSVELPGTYWIDMYDDGAGWQPVEHLPMPYHHVGRIELTNAADFSNRFGRGTRRARFFIEVRSRRIHPATAGRPSLATYRAHVLDLCVLRSRL